MKRFQRNLCRLLAFAMMLCALPMNVLAEVPGAEEMRAVWVATVLNIDYPSKKALPVDTLKNETDYIIQKSKEMGMNAIVFQVRPTGDAFYESDIFPWSEYLTGSQGVAPEGGFDPLAYWIEQAHANDMELHAWINPYRVSHASTKRSSVDTLALKNPARKNPSWVVAYKDGLYYDPGLPETQQLVIDGVKEILQKYEVDGIHLDDYFYPGKDFPDSATYALYGGTMSKDDWRRSNVDSLIQGIQTAVEETKPEVQYGISPFAIWQNASSSALGSDTKGNESYSIMYADTRKWVKEGWLDYICPQIYWQMGFNIADYEKVLTWWEEVCRGTDVDLYIGQAAYRESEKQSGWQGEIVRQLKRNEQSDIVKGSIFFSFKSLENTLGTQVKQYYADKDYLNTVVLEAPSAIPTVQ